jgi:NAD+ synthetase
VIKSGDELEDIWNALVLGLRDYVGKNGFPSVILGLSGGIDSAFVALVAREAFGANNVIAVFMPSKFTTKQSIKDAEQVADNLQIELKTIPIDSILNSYASDLEFLSGIAYENIQARIRGNILMALSNSVNGLVLTTGNKSEIATGYCTIYGDMCGAFNPIKDLYKTTLYNVVKWRNKTIPKHQSKYFILKEYNLIPNSIVTKSPSAELRENQKDSDSLPEYNLLDQILHNYIEKSLSVNEIISLGFDEKIVNQVASLVNLSEYKRKQSAPGIKITKQSFEKAEWKLNTKIQ